MKILEYLREEVVSRPLVFLHKYIAEPAKEYTPLERMHKLVLTNLYIKFIEALKAADIPRSQDGENIDSEVWLTSFNDMVDGFKAHYHRVDMPAICVELNIDNDSHPLHDAHHENAALSMRTFEQMTGIIQRLLFGDPKVPYGKETVELKGVAQFAEQYPTCQQALISEEGPDSGEINDKFAFQNRLLLIMFKYKLARLKDYYIEGSEAVLDSVHEEKMQAFLNAYQD